jgi:hypothetical protein
MNEGRAGKSWIKLRGSDRRRKNKLMRFIIRVIEGSGGFWSTEIAGEPVAAEIRDLIRRSSVGIGAALTVDVGKTSVGGKQVVPRHESSGEGVRGT